MGKKELIEKIITSRMVVEKLEKAQVEPRRIKKATLTLIGWEREACCRGIDLGNV
jgi:hypothetical protein